MSSLTNIFLGAGSVTPTATGTEMPQTRRQLDFTDVQYARLTYSGTGLSSGDVTFGMNYSADSGATWTQLLPPGAPMSVSNFIYVTAWVETGLAARSADVWVSLFAYGTSLLAPLTATLSAAELQLR